MSDVRLSGVDLGIFLPTMSRSDATPGDVVAAARHAEALGFESVWAVDQLIAGVGVPLIDSVIALSAAAGATSRVRLGFGVLVVPLRPTTWIAKQVASLQHVSGDRVLLGIGVGGDRHERSWAAADVPRRERGARTDATLSVLRPLLAGEDVTLTDRPDAPSVRLAPGVAPPPLLVGGVGEAAMERVLRWGDGWFGLPVPPEDAATSISQLRARARELGRTPPTVTTSIVTALEGDPALPPPERLVAQLTDPDGTFGMPPEMVPSILVTDGARLRERVAAWAELDITRVVISVAAGDWHRQAELAATALDLTPDSASAA